VAITLPLYATFIRSCEDGQWHLEARLGNVEMSDGARALVISLDQAYARFTVVSAVGAVPPHHGHSGDQPSTVECAVREAGNIQRGMASPTVPAGTSRSSRRMEHGDSQSPHGANVRRRKFVKADLSWLPTPWG
jgi:hypothetical protein